MNSDWHEVRKYEVLDKANLKGEVGAGLQKVLVYAKLIRKVLL